MNSQPIASSSSPSATLMIPTQERRMDLRRSGSSTADHLAGVLETLNNQFDPEFVHTSLDQAFTMISENFMLDEKVATLLKNTARKYGIPKSLLSRCVNWVANCDERNSPLIVKRLCGILKYAASSLKNDISVEEGTSIDTMVELALSAYDKISDLNSRSQLTEAIGYLVPHICNGSNVKTLLANVATYTDINESAKSFLQEQLRRESLESKFHKDSSEDWSEVQEQINRYQSVGFNNSTLNGRPSATYIVQTQRAVVTSSMSFQSEKATFDIQNLIDTVKSKSAMKVRSRSDPKAEVRPTLEDVKSGKDRWWFQDTYQIVESCYKKVTQGIDLKDDELDNYLPEKLLGRKLLDGKNWKTWSWWGPTANTHILITEIFMLASKRKQRLKPSAIDKLFICLSNHVDVDDEQKALGLTPEKIAILRRNAIHAISNQLKHGGSVLCQGCAKWECPHREGTLKYILNRYKSGRYSDITKVTYAILRFFSSETSNPQLFETALSQLHSQSNLSVEEALVYIGDIERHTWDLGNSREYFSLQNLHKLLEIVISPNVVPEIRIGCGGILRSYLTNYIPDAVTLSVGCIHQLILIVLTIVDVDPDSFEETNREEFTSTVMSVIILAVDKLVSCEISFVRSLVDHCDTLPKKWSVYFLVAIHSLLEKISLDVNQRYTSAIKITPGLVSKLSDSDRILSDSGKISFESCEIENEYQFSNEISVSFISATIILKFIKLGSSCSLLDGVSSLYGGKESSLLDFTTLTDHLTNSEDKQTRILLAEIFYEIKVELAAPSLESKGIDEVFTKLFKFCNDPIADVGVYFKVITCYFACVAAEKCFELSPNYISQIAEIYVILSISLEEKDFTEEINTNILNFLSLLSYKEVPFLEGVFTSVFDKIFQAGITNSNLEKALLIVSQVVSNLHPLPSSTLFSLCNVVDIDEVHELTINIFKQCVEIGQEVPDKAIRYFSAMLLDKEVEKNTREEAFRILDLANNNQELTDEDFDRLEMERAAIAWNFQENFQVFKNSLSFILGKVNNMRQLTATTVEKMLVFLNSFASYHLEVNANAALASIVLNIFSVSIENREVPDSLFTTLIEIISSDTSINLLHAICKLLQTAIKNSCAIPDCQSLVQKLESTLGLPSLDNELFCDTFDICYQISVDHGLKLNDVSIALLMDKIRTEYCRKKLMHMLPLIVKNSHSQDIFKKAKTLFGFYLSNSNNEFEILSSIRGFQAIYSIFDSPELSLLEEVDLDVLISFASNSDDIKMNQEILTLINYHEGRLSTVQEESKSKIVTNETLLNDSDFLSKFELLLKEKLLKISQIQKYLKYIPKILFERNSFKNVLKSLNILKQLSINKKALELIVNPEILSPVVHILHSFSATSDQINQFAHEVVFKILHNIFKTQTSGVKPLSITDIVAICEFYKSIEKPLQDNFEELLTLMHKFEWKSLEFTSVIESTLLVSQTTVKNATFETIKDITKRLIQGKIHSADIQKLASDLMTEFIRDVECSVEDLEAKSSSLTPHLIQNTLSKLENHASLLFIFIARGELHFECVESFAKKVNSFINASISLAIRNEEGWSEPFLTADAITAYRIVLQFFGRRNFGDTSCFYKLICNCTDSYNSCKLFDLLVTATIENGSESDRLIVVIFEYFIEMLKYSNDSTEVQWVPRLVKILESKTVTNNPNPIVRFSWFELFLALNEKQIFNKYFQNWVEAQIAKFRGITTKVFANDEKQLAPDIVELLRAICLSQKIPDKYQGWENLSVDQLTKNVLQRNLLFILCIEHDEISCLDLVTNIKRLSNKAEYHQNPVLLTKVMQQLTISFYKGNVLLSDLPSISICLNHISYQKASQILLSNNSCEKTFVEINECAISDIVRSKSNFESDVCNLIKTFDFAFYDLYLILNCLNRIDEDEVDTFKAVLKFLKTHDIPILNFSNEKFPCPSELLRKIEMNTLGKKFISPNPETLTKGIFLLNQLFNKGFKFDDLHKLFTTAQKNIGQSNGNVLHCLTQLLKLLLQFVNPQPTDQNKENCFKNFKPSKMCAEIENVFKSKSSPKSINTWFLEVNQKFVKYLFDYRREEAQLIGSGSGDGQLHEIFKELKTINQSLPIKIDVEDQVEANEFEILQNLVEQIRSLNKLKVQFVEADPAELSEIQTCMSTPIKDWDKKMFKAWALSVKNNASLVFTNRNFIVDALSVIMWANKRVYNYELKDTQIISVLLAIIDHSNSGRRSRGLLQQVLTGEGKSTIIRILAILQALLGKKVCIVTSNSVLAERDARNSKKLFDFFNITVDHNGDKQNYISGAKACYTRDVIVGTCAQFQFDILRDEYSRLCTLSGCHLDIVIVDEVDSMFIDDSSKFARLASEIPGMDLIEIIYHLIWDRLCFIQNRIFFVNNEAYFTLGKLTVNPELGSLTLEISDSNGNINTIPEIRQFVLENDFSGICVKISDSIPVFIENNLKTFIKAIVTDEVISDPEYSQAEKLKMPYHFKEFIKDQIPRWVENALLARSYVENAEYVVEDGKIKPVDFDTSGEVQSQSIWSDGLHQFLQIQHNLAVTPETLATNFLSTVGFFDRFKSEDGNSSRIFGFTGTFGSEPAKEYLRCVFNVDLVSIPPSSPKKFHIFSDIITKSNKEWISAIMDSIRFEVEKGRAVLVICRTIGEARMVHSLILKFSIVASSRLKLFVKNDYQKNSDKHVERVCPGEVIVATNLAGRGTDIKTTKAIELNGGLHVCLTFQPLTQRAVDQLLGRTSRQGNYGTAQFILLQMWDEEDIRVSRISYEKLSLANKRNLLANIREKDRLFRKYCELLATIRTNLKTAEGLCTKVKTCFGVSIESEFEKCILSAVEERWGFLIRKIECNSIISENSSPTTDELEAFSVYVDGEYRAFETDIQGATDFTDIEKWIKLIESPFYATRLGNYFMKEKADGKKAFKLFEHAITLDEHFSVGAHVGKAWYFVTGESRMYFWNGHKTDYKIIALKELRQALKLSTTEKDYLSTINVLYMNRTKETYAIAGDKTVESDLSNQIIQKLIILDNYVKSVEEASDVIVKSSRLVDIIYKPEILSHSGRFEGREVLGMARDIGSLRFSLTSSSLVNLTFRDLTCANNDMIASDQAVNFINSLSPEQFQKCAISVMGAISSDRIMKFLDPHISHVRLSKTEALSALGGNAITHSFKKWVGYGDTTMNCVIYSYDANNVESKELFPNILGSKVYKQISKSAETCKFDLTFENKIRTEFNSANSSFKLTLFDFDVSNPNGQLLFDLLPLSQVEIEIRGKRPHNLKDFFSKNRLTFDKKRITLVSIDKENDQNEDARNTVHCFYNAESNESWKDVSSVRISMLGWKWSNLFVELQTSSPSVFTDLAFDVNVGQFGGEALLQHLKFHKGGEVKLQVICQSNSHLKKLIPELRNAGFEIGVSISSLKYYEAVQLMRSSKIEEADLSTAGVRTLSSIFTPGYEPPEVWQFTSRGSQYILRFGEKEFIPVYSISVVCGLGLLQIAAGGLLVATGLGAPVGLALLTEGCVDLVWGVQAFSTRELSLSSFGLQKSVSIAISVGTLGLGALKNAGKGFQSFVTAVGTEAIEQGAQKVIITKGGEASQKVLSMLAAKQGVISVAEVAATQVLFQAANQFTDKVFESFSDSLLEDVCRELEIKSVETSLLISLNRLRISHKCLPNLSKLTLEKKVELIMNEILNGNKSPVWQHNLQVVAGMICTGLVNVHCTSPNSSGNSSNSETSGLFSGLSTFVKLGMMIRSCTEIKAILHTICCQVIEQLKSYEQSVFSLEKVIESKCNIELGDAKSIALVYGQRIGNPNANLSFYDFVANSENLLEAVNTIPVSDLDQATSDLLKTSNIITVKLEIRRCIESLQKGIAEAPEATNLLKDHSVIARTIADGVVSEISNATKSNLVTPVASVGISYLVRNASDFVQSKCIVNVEESSESFKNEVEKFKSLMEKRLYNEVLSEADTHFLNSFKHCPTRGLTIAKQIYQHGRDFETAYNLKALLEMNPEAHNLLNDMNGSVDVIAQVFAEKVKSTKRAGLVETIHLVGSQNLAVIVTDNVSQVPMLLEKHPECSVIVYSHAMDCNSPFRLYNDKGQIVSLREGQQNLDCSYPILEHLTQKSESDLREIMARDILKHDDVLLRKIDADEWLIKSGTFGQIRLRAEGKLNSFWSRDNASTMKKMQRDLTKFVNDAGSVCLTMSSVVAEAIPKLSSAVTTVSSQVSNSSPTASLAANSVESVTNIMSRNDIDNRHVRQQMKVMAFLALCIYVLASICSPFILTLIFMAGSFLIFARFQRDREY